MAIVTASTAGIGLGIARRLAQEGAAVVVSSRKAVSVAQTVETLRAEGFKVQGIACHVADKVQVARLVQFTIDTLGRLDILVSTAAVNPATGPILELEDAALDNILDINSEHG